MDHLETIVEIKNVVSNEFIDKIIPLANHKAKKNMMDIQQGDVPATHADVKALENYTGFRPKTSVEQGVQNFVEWYKNVYK